MKPCPGCGKEIGDGERFCCRGCFKAHGEGRKAMRLEHSVRCRSTAEEQKLGDADSARIKAIAERLRGEVISVRCAACGQEANMKDGTWVWGRRGNKAEAWYHLCPGRRMMVEGVKDARSAI